MLSIIAGHWLNMIGIYDYQLLAIGVEIFLILSGYLYKEKRIDKISVFAKNRYRRLYIPYIWTMFFLCTVLLLGGV